MLKLLLSLSSLMLMPAIVQARTEVQKINFKKLSAGMGRVEVVLNKKMGKVPHFEFKGRQIRLLIPGVVIPERMVKRISLRKKFDTVLTGRQLDKDFSVLGVKLPYHLWKGRKKVNVNIRGKKIHLNFPVVAMPAKARGIIGKNRVKGIAQQGAHIPRSKDRDRYDEAYLEQLLRQKKQRVGDAVVAVDHKTDVNDVVKTKFSASPKVQENSFSFAAQAGKFVGFLALVILLFYGVILLLKKSMFNKGKLGFLNSTKIVEVLNTTYVAPKRNLILVRAHNQVFLLGSSEKGLHSLGELSDVNGLLKRGEKEISGVNFDTSIESAKEKDKEFRLKDLLEDNLGKASEEKNLPKAAIEVGQIKEKVKLSEQIKNKVKGLKSLQ